MRTVTISYLTLGIVAVIGIAVLRGTRGRPVAAVAAPIDNGGPVIDVASGTAFGGALTTHGEPYQNQGIFGILGSVSNDVLGGAPQAFGEWIGDKLSGNDPTASASATNQSTTGNPYSPGPSALYANAIDASPTNQLYAASPFTQTPYSTTTVVDDSGTTTDYGT